MSRLNFKPKLPSEIIDPTLWKEYDRVWIEEYVKVVLAHSLEQRSRITFQDKCERLESENQFLVNLVN